MDLAKIVVPTDRRQGTPFPAERCCSPTWPRWRLQGVVRLSAHSRGGAMVPPAVRQAQTTKPGVLRAASSSTGQAASRAEPGAPDSPAAAIGSRPVNGPGSANTRTAAAIRGTVDLAELAPRPRIGLIGAPDHGPVSGLDACKTTAHSVAVGVTSVDAANCAARKRRPDFGARGLVFPVFRSASERQ